MAMDSSLNAIWKEIMKKEQKFQKKAAEQARAKKERMMGDKTLTATRSAPQLYSSCAINYLDQNMGLASNPHGAHVVRAKDADPMDLLLHGVSHEGQGKAAYLRHRTHAGGPHERYGRAATSAQEVGWTSKLVTTHNASPFANRSAIKNEFFRTMGVSLASQ